MPAALGRYFPIRFPSVRNGPFRSMSLNPDVESRSDSWRRELRGHVRELIESEVGGPIDTDADPYSDGRRVGYAPLPVLFAGRCITDTDRAALDPAAAVEFARLHLRAHWTLAREGGASPTALLLAGDLYRALANQLLVEQNFPVSRRLEAVEILSESVLNQLEAIGVADSKRPDWLLADGATEISTVLFALDDEQRQTLRAYSRRLRSDRGGSPPLSSVAKRSENGVDD